MIQRVILWFVGLLPKKLQQIYARYEEQWLYLIYGVLTTVVSMVTKLVPLYLVHQDAVSKVFYTTYSAGCAVFSWICAVTFAFLPIESMCLKAARIRKPHSGRNSLPFMLDGWLRWALMLD